SSTGAKSPEAVVQQAATPVVADIDQPAETPTRGSAESPAGDAAQPRSFGGDSVAIVNVEVLGADGQPCAVFYPREPLAIRITCRTYVRIGKLNVAIRIRNKEGVKIYSWGTLNQDMELRAAGQDDAMFWSRE